MTAVVTGAASGIGARSALGLAEFGADVGCIDVSEDGLKATVHAIEEIGRRAIALPLDVTDTVALAAAIERVEAELGPLQGAINCAGVHSNAPAEDVSRDTWQHLLDINLTGVIPLLPGRGARHAA